MGAIAGIVSRTPWKEEVSDIRKTMRDHSRTQIMRTDTGTFLCSGPLVNLCRERILNGEKYTLLFSGHIYNEQEIREDMISSGEEMRKEDTSEMLLHGYVRFGPEFLKKLRGGFSVAVWEYRKQRLFLGRDQLGIAPLFYSLMGENLIFASEIKNILAFPGIKPRLDREGMQELVLLGPGKIPGSGVLKDIRELEPGSWAIWEAGKLTVRPYWQLKDREHRDSFQDTCEKTAWLVRRSFSRQTEDLKEYGCFLSGGLDSSILTALAAEKNPGLETFSVDYQGNDVNFVPGKFEPGSDGAFIAEMTKAFPCLHRNIVLTPEDLMGNLYEAVMGRDLPGMGDVDASLLAFCRKVSAFVPAVFSGECADEIFGGYPWFRDPKMQGEDHFPWAQNTDMRLKLLNHPAENGEEWVRERLIGSRSRVDVLPGTDPQEKKYREMTVLNIRWFMQTLMIRNDAMSARADLEVRTPFCDVDLLEYVYSIPREMKDYDGREKGLLRQAFQGLLPDPVRLRKKSPYPKTFDPHYTELVRKELQTVLHKDRPIWEIISQKEVITMLNEEAEYPWYGQLMRKPQFMAWLLQVDFWLNQYGITLEI